MAPQHPYTHDDPFDQGFLQVSHIHKLYYEQYGPKDGKPVVFVHGGPGGSTPYEHTAYFNPAIYRVVLFDQRGSGKSIPAADIWENTSQLLAPDIETLRKSLGIERWFMVFGGRGDQRSLCYTHKRIPKAFRAWF